MTKITKTPRRRPRKKPRQYKGRPTATAQLRSDSDRDERGRFQPGNRCSVGNRGRAGQRGLAAALEAKVTPAHWRNIVRRARDQAEAGDATARDWLANRAAGRSRPEDDFTTIALELPPLDDPAGCAEAAACVVRAAAAGDVTLEEAERTMALVDQAREALILRDLHDRLALVEDGG